MSTYILSPTTANDRVESPLAFLAPLQFIYPLLVAPYLFIYRNTCCSWYKKPHSSGKTIWRP